MIPAPKKRGRPRAFAEPEVLARATEVFLRHGYAGASLELLTTAMGMSKPSLYAAFGDKRRLFFRVLEERTTALGAGYQAAFARGDSLEASLLAIFEHAIATTAAADTSPGCIISSASATEAVVDDRLALFTREFFRLCDRAIGAWIEAAYAPRGPIAAATLGRLANGTLHEIALRARVGEPKTMLRAHAREAAQTLAIAASAPR